MIKHFPKIIFFCCGSMLSALDLKTALIEIENDKLNTTILPMQYHQWPGEGRQEPRIRKADRIRFAKRMKTEPNSTGENDEEMFLSQNGRYFEYRRYTHTTTYWRQFVLFEKTPGQWVMAVSLANTPRESEWSDLYFLCKVSGRWADCTKRFVSPISLESFLKEGKVLNEETRANSYLKYSIAESGELIEIQITSVIPTPAVPPGAAKPTVNYEFKDFKGVSFRLRWRENTMKYELEP
ncbi:MAG: hypothetical protein U1F27_03235 [Turneriella sp.]